jgi:hypothetical protein
MIKLGYKLMSEKHGPAELVRNANLAEQAGSISPLFPITFFRGSRSKAIRRSPGRFLERWPTPPAGSP